MNVNQSPYEALMPCMLRVLHGKEAFPKNYFLSSQQVPIAWFLYTFVNRLANQFLVPRVVKIAVWNVKGRSLQGLGGKD
jgi:hypothetical protein